MTDPLPALAELERSGRLEDAAQLASESNLHAEASRLWEQACRYECAAASALASGDAGRAFILAVRAGSPEQENAALVVLCETPEQARRVAEGLYTQHQHAPAARIFRTLSDFRAAADNFERAGMWFDAALAHREASDVLAEARCLQRVVREDPKAGRARLRLGELLLDQRQFTAGIAVLQRIDDADPLRVPALPLLARAFADLGLVEAERESIAELSARGGAVPARTFEESPRIAPVEGVLFGRYRVITLIETTATARLYHAEDLLSGAHVAVKLFSAATLSDTGRDALKMFQREVQILQKLEHPAIVPLVEYEPSANAAILAWMEGGSLADLLARGTVSPARAAEIISSVLGALHEAHRRGILHRDIKPSNILFDAGGAAKLSDFGVAHLSDAAATITKGLIGTLSYMAPEQRAGEAASIESDIYSVGAVFWQMLTGAPPMSGLDFLSDKIAAEHEHIASSLIAAKHERPSSAREAEAAIMAVSWPETVPLRRESTPRPQASLETKQERLEALADGSYFDRLLERRIQLVAADPALLDRARELAQTPEGAAILAYHGSDSKLWVLASAENVLAELRMFGVDDAISKA